MNGIRTPTLLAFLLLVPGTASAAGPYGDKGVFPVYRSGKRWVIFNRDPEGSGKSLERGSRFLVIGSRGASVFEVSRASNTYGGACREGKSIAIPASLLRGSQRKVGDPVIAIKVPARFSLKGSKARFNPLSNQVSEQTYRTLDELLRNKTMEDLRSGRFPVRFEDREGVGKIEKPGPSEIQLKFDFGSEIGILGLKGAFALVEGTQILGSYRRCLRIVDGVTPVGDCVVMPHDLMTETSNLRFVSFDPSGRGKPYLLAYTKNEPLWGHERWAFMLREQGPRLLLSDTMDIRCRESF